MSARASKLSFKEKAGYSLGDASANFVFQTLLIFQTAFYTDIFGLSAAAVGWLLLFVRFSDAITDPIMGFLADRTNHRWGKFRPWLLWSAVPFAVLFWLTFTRPDLSAGSRLFYAYATYALLMIAYTANNVPYSALNGVMTGDVHERTSLSSFRFFAAMATAFVVQGLTLPLVGKLGGGDDAKGWSLTIAIYAAIALVFFFVTFASVKERVQPPPGQKSSIKQDVADAVRNVPWLAMFGMTLFVFITLSMRGGGMYYYFTYYVDPAAVSAFIQKLGLVAAPGSEGGFGRAILSSLGLIVVEGANPSKVGFSVFNMVGGLVQIAGVLAAKPLAERFGKKAVFIAGLAGTTVVTGAFYVNGPADVGAMFVFTVLWALCYGPTIPLLWAMIADAADYGEWKNHRRATGFVYAGIVFALKAGLGFGGAIGGWILAAHGYQANAAQSAEALEGIRLTASIYSAIPFALGVACMLLYPIGKELNLRIGEELARRRSDQPPDVSVAPQPART